jgi:hypothetical protein
MLGPLVSIPTAKNAADVGVLEAHTGLDFANQQYTHFWLSCMVVMKLFDSNKTTFPLGTKNGCICAIPDWVLVNNDILGFDLPLKL